MARKSTILDVSKDVPKHSIDRDIPIPNVALKKEGIYPWEQMEVGDSFFVSREESLKVSAAAASRKKRHPDFDYVMRRDGAGTRIWRVGVQP